MSDLRTTLEHDLRRVGPASFDLDQLARVRDRRRRNRRIRAGALGLAILTALVAVLASTIAADRGSDLLTTPGPLPSNGRIVVAGSFEGPGGSGGRDGGLYLVGDGTARRIVGAENDGAGQTCPRFSPDGTRLAYVESSRQPGESAARALVVTALDDAGAPTGPQQRIPGGTCAEWSPDGRQLVYPSVGLWVVEPGEGPPRRVMEPYGVPRIGDIEWSPDGTTIATIDEDGRVVLVSADGADRRVLGGPAGSTLSWSPDGNRIALGRDASEGGPNDSVGIRVVDVDSGIGSWLDTGEPAIGGDPHWSPDGRSVAFVHGGRIYLSAVPSGDLVRLPPVHVSELSEGPLDVWDVQWSPDGRRLLSIAAVLGSAEPTYALVSVPTDGTAPTRIESPASFGLYWTTPGDLDWQPVHP